MSTLLRWPTIRLKELASKKKNAIVGGPFGSNLVTSDYQSEGIPVIRGVNLPINGRFSCKNFVFVSEKKGETLKQNLAEPNDLVFTQRGTLGQVGIIPTDTPYEKFLISQSQMKMTVNLEMADPNFLYYFFKMPSTIKYIENHALQSGVPHINLGILKNFEVIFPPLGVQKKIAAILSAYDDLIENNKRRIALLEQMAEEIYREWFVRFRFPGWKEAKFIKGIPKGWTFEKVGKAFKFLGGGTPSKENESYWEDGNVNWFTPTDITGSEGIFLFSSNAKCNEEGLARSSAKLFPAYSVMMTSRATIGMVGINTTPASTNQGFITSIPNERYPLTYLYHWLKLSRPFFELVSVGSTFSELIKGTFKKIDILKPPKQVVNEFDLKVGAMFRLIENLQALNANLARTKNQLLPRLISGKLSVENLDIQFPPSMQDSEDQPTSA